MCMETRVSSRLRHQNCLPEVRISGQKVGGTVYQLLGLYLGPLKCCADNIRQRLPVHFLLLRDYYVVRCYMQV